MLVNDQRHGQHIEDKRGKINSNPRRSAHPQAEDRTGHAQSRREHNDPERHESADYQARTVGPGFDYRAVAYQCDHREDGQQREHEPGIMKAETEMDLAQTRRQGFVTCFPLAASGVDAGSSST